MKSLLHPFILPPLKNPCGIGGGGQGCTGFTMSNNTGGVPLIVFRIAIYCYSFVTITLQFCEMFVHVLFHPANQNHSKKGFLPALECF